MRYTVRPILLTGALARLPGHEEKLLLLVPIPLDAALVSALRRYPVTTLKRIQLPAEIPNPVIDQINQLQRAAENGAFDPLMVWHRAK